MKRVWVVPVALVILAVGWSLWRNAEVQRSDSTGQACLSRLKSLAGAIHIYAADHDDHLMPASTWAEAVAPYGGSSEATTCPGSKRFGYEYLRDLDAEPVKAFKDPGAQIAIFDSGLLVQNASGGLNDLPSPPRHGDRNSVLYLDGHSGFLGPDRRALKATP